LDQTAPICFDIDWLDSVEGVECKTLARISVQVDGVTVWPVTGEDTETFEWFADEFLAHLAECWKPIIVRQTYPIPVQPERPSYLIVEAKKRWASLPEATIENEERQVSAFEDAHNLANAFGGVSGLLPLWLLRDRDTMIVDTQERLLRVPIHDAIEALTAAGDQIAAQLLDADSAKWTKLARAWKQRESGDGTLLLALTIGRDKNTAAVLVHENILDVPSSFSEAVNDNDELRIAARMTGAIPVNQVKNLIGKIRECDLIKAEKLRADATEATAILSSDDLCNTRPHVQGSAVAKWLREKLDTPRGIDPLQILERYYRVDVRYFDFEMRSLDGVAVWGPRHGPSVLLNTNSARVRSKVNPWRSGAVRVTAAHELCHLLLDSQHTLSAVDILGGRMPIHVEQRARAFAAEFLLPKNAAATTWKAEGHPFDPSALRSVILSLCKKYKVTESVAAWQLQHGAPPDDQERLDKILDQIVPHR
jgi:Zn-dependent peptidase ImmA (M78 family)